MRNKHIDIQGMNDAINEYLTSNSRYIDICNKYNIKSYTFFYHLKKFRNLNNQNGGNVNNCNKNVNNSNATISSDAYVEGNKIVTIKTNTKKMQEYMKQHSMSECSHEHTIDSHSEKPSQSNSQLETKRKKAPQRITDVDALFESIKI